MPSYDTHTVRGQLKDQLLNFSASQFLLFLSASQRRNPPKKFKHAHFTCSCCTIIISRDLQNMCLLLSIYPYTSATSVPMWCLLLTQIVIDWIRPTAYLSRSCTRHSAATRSAGSVHAQYYHPAACHRGCGAQLLCRRSQCSSLGQTIAMSHRHQPSRTHQEAVALVGSCGARPWWRTSPRS